MQMYIFISHLSPAYVFCIFPLKDAFDLYPVVFDEVSVNIKNNNPKGKNRYIFLFV